ncbi:AAA family ATPase, partial [Erythrobacter sp. NE805]|uniref:AAA family ATPase n=1 Tax=Erythrobacter sp. NE805 TaxID=3389875 RepID=UPI00396B104F
MASQAQETLSAAIEQASLTPEERFIEEQIAWLKAHKEGMGASFADIANWTGIPHGTVSNLLGKGYAGNRKKYADIIATYRHTLTAQSEIAADLPEKPGYFETPTSKAIMHYLHWAQRGRLVLIVTGAGLGKSTTAEQFLKDNIGSYMATMTPSTSGIMPMQQKVLRALGEKHVIGSPAALTEMIIEKLKGPKNPVLLIDEAQHLSIKALDELRSIYDATGAGLVLMGNERVQQSIDGVSRAADFAQLFSRIGLRLVRQRAVTGDAEALAAAWN